jgi:hypothetical protein
MYYLNTYNFACTLGKTKSDSSSTTTNIKQSRLLIYTSELPDNIKYFFKNLCVYLEKGERWNLKFQSTKNFIVVKLSPVD